jgi:hypothetical protein
VHFPRRSGSGSPSSLFAAPRDPDAGLHRCREKRPPSCPPTRRPRFLSERDRRLKRGDPPRASNLAACALGPCPVASPSPVLSWRHERVRLRATFGAAYVDHGRLDRPCLGRGVSADLGHVRRPANRVAYAAPHGVSQGHVGLAVARARRVPMNGPGFDRRMMRAAAIAMQNAGVVGEPVIHFID